jgi:hypothetical protein
MLVHTQFPAFTPGVWGAAWPVLAQLDSHDHPRLPDFADMRMIRKMRRCCLHGSCKQSVFLDDIIIPENIQGGQCGTASRRFPV